MAGKRAGMMLKPRSCQLRAGNAIKVCHIYTGDEKQTWLQRLKQGLLAAYQRVVGGQSKAEQPKEERKQPESQPKPTVAKVDNTTQTSEEGTYTPRRRSESFAKPKKPVNVQSSETKACWTPQRPALPRAKVVCDMKLLEKYKAGSEQEERFAKLLRASSRKTAEVQTDLVPSIVTVQPTASPPVFTEPRTPLPSQAEELYTESAEMDTDEVVEYDLPCPVTPIVSLCKPADTPSQPSVFGGAACQGSFHLGRLPSKSKR